MAAGRVREGQQGGRRAVWDGAVPGEETSEEGASKRAVAQWGHPSSRDVVGGRYKYRMQAGRSVGGGGGISEQR